MQTDFGRSRIEAIALADRSLQWLRSLGISLSPGQVRLSVPATAARRYARERRILATITALDVAEDTEIWQSYGLGALQCRRLLRWLYEIYHQGGWASLAELAAWANLTPTALAARLKPARELGIWLPHVGGRAPQPETLALGPWLVNRFLQGEPVEEIRARLGITTGVWEAILRRFVRLLEGFQAGGNPDELAAGLGLSPLEAQQFLALPQCCRHKARLRELRDSYGTPAPNAVNSAAGIEAELVSSYGFLSTPA